MKVDGAPGMKPFWEITAAEAESCLAATQWYPAMTEYFRGGGYSSGFLTLGGMPCTMSRLNLVEGLGPVLQIAEGWTVDLPEKVHEALERAHQPDVADALVRAARRRPRAVPRRLHAS